MFTMEDMYSLLQNETLLKILLYLKEKNPKVPLADLAKFIGKTREDTLGLLNLLYSKGIVEIEAPEKYTLNFRTRNVLQALLA
jgi:Mn-dependent DtxR family transcriptional regulator